ncbi:MAG: heat-inducible transcriptional repressor HrcA [Candidatus Latescibacterota bacterium]
MDLQALSEREATVLQSLVEAHIELGEPIGSRTLCERQDWDISSATVRATLARLEDLGFVTQPHTSAGRVPTDKGYRFYVAQRTSQGGFGQEAEEVRLREELERRLREGSYDQILAQLAQVLGEVSHQLGLVMAPRFEQGLFDRLELVQLASNRLLIVLSIRHGLVKSLVMEVDSLIHRDELEAMARLLNERLHGLSMAQIRRSIRERVSSLHTGNPHLLKAVTDEIQSLALAAAADLHVAGARNICLQPEFHDPARMAELMDLVERRDLLVRLLSARKGMVITIGKENLAQAMQLCSVVTASYEVNGAWGVIGVVGPMRMPYGRVVNLVNCAADRAAWLAA